MNLLNYIFKTQTFRTLILIFLILYYSPTYSQQKTVGLIKHLLGNYENGYVLFAPLECKTTYLIDKCGRQIHSWKSNYSPGFSAYLLPDGSLLRTGIYKDTTLIKGSNGGVIEKLGWDGEVIWTYLLLNDSLGQHHDIFPMENGNILVVTRHVIKAKEAIAKGRKSGTLIGNKLYSERIIELKPLENNDAEIVWQWSLWDHIIQNEDILKPNYGIVGNHPELMNINFCPVQTTDWIHINSIDYNKELDQILLSCKSLNEIWIIDHSTTTKEAKSHSGGNSEMGGDILYRWGNPAAYDQGTSKDQKFFHQHNAHWIAKGYKDEGDIMVFNNGLNRIPSYSSVEIIQPPIYKMGMYKKDLPFGPTSYKWIYKDSIPEKFFSGFKSGASRLINGNLLVCSGLDGKLFEVDTNNRIVWEYINPVGSGDNILNDGETGGSVVFKCIFYSDTFLGFKGKTLEPAGPIEKNYFQYLCSTISQDSVPPLKAGLFPDNGSKKVAINSKLFITFSENIYKGKSGFIRVYENSELKETIQITSEKISISGKVMAIKTKDNFLFNSKISISIDQGSCTDFSGNKILALKSENWTFYTEK
ncbi:MAG: aryl-sulfate sulfotransferase [Bacteroidia bacterium]